MIVVIFLILYADNILLIENNILIFQLLKLLLSKNLSTKDMDEATKSIEIDPEDYSTYLNLYK